MWPFSSGSSNSQDPSSCQSCPASSSGSSSSHAATKQLHPGLKEVSDPAQRLPTDRVISSIPRYKSNSEENVNGENSASACPVKHSDQNDSKKVESSDQNWVYPSPAQFYKALVRKNRPAEAADMYTVVPIHNAVNERVWREVLEWEASYGRGSFDRWPRSGKSGPMLCSFRGRPNDTSPRAWMKILSGYQPPFDRHDWEVVRPTEERMRYVIDFYPGRGADELHTTNTSSKDSIRPPPNLSFYIDVRPALDNWEGFRMRILRSWDEIRNSFSSQSASSTKSP